MDLEFRNFDTFFKKRHLLIIFYMKRMFFKVSKPLNLNFNNFLFSSNFSPFL